MDMAKDEAGEWVAWTNSGKLKPGEMPGFGVLRRSVLLHDGGPSYMSIGPEFKNKIVKRYGRMTKHEWENLVSSGKLHRDFPPIPTDPKSFAPYAEGWISPNGELYSCCYGMHEVLAERLCALHGIVELRDWLKRDGDLLVGRRWIKVCQDYISVEDSDLLQPQIDTLFDMLKSPAAAFEDSGIKKSINRILQTKE